jgi:hypothetical protein
MGISYFPSPLPDETLHSQLSRFHLLSGTIDSRITMDLFFGTHTHLATSLLPSHLDHMAHHLPVCLGITRGQLLERSTLLPYYRPFMPNERLTRCEELSGGANAGALKIGTGMAASRVGGDNPFRFCRHCVTGDLRQFGVAYWHRAHQLPGVYVCATHALPLMQPDAFFRHRGRVSLFLPALVLASPACAAIAVPAPHQDALGKIAALSAELLASGVQPITSTRLRAFYLEQAQRLGWTSLGRRLRIPMVLAAADRLAQALPQEGDYAFLTGPSGTGAQWVLQLLRKQRVCIPPLRHLALLILLDSDWESLRYSLTRPATGMLAAAPEVGISKGGAREGGATARSDALAALARGECTLTEANRRAGLSVTTLSILAQREGIALKLKPKTLTKTRTDALETALASRIGLPALAAASGVSQVSLYRILKARPDLARRRQCLLREEEVAVRRARYLEGLEGKVGRRSPDYIWLYRNDREFLLAALKLAPAKTAKKRRIDWPARDAQFAKSIEDSVHQLLHVEPPAQLTKTRLSLATGRQAVVQKSIGRLPLTLEALRRHEESLASFLLRKSRWSQQHLGG